MATGGGTERAILAMSSSEMTPGPLGMCETRPSADAPIWTASRASSTLEMQQIFMRGTVSMDLLYDLTLELGNTSRGQASAWTNCYTTPLLHAHPTRRRRAKSRSNEAGRWVRRDGLSKQPHTYTLRTCCGARADRKMDEENELCPRFYSHRESRAFSCNLTVTIILCYIITWIANSFLINIHEVFYEW